MMRSLWLPCLAATLLLSTGCFSYLEAGGGMAANVAGDGSGVGPSLHAEYGIIPIALADDATLTLTVGASLARFDSEGESGVVAGGFGASSDWGNVLYTDDLDRVVEWPIYTRPCLLESERVLRRDLIRTGRSALISTPMSG